ncbi:CLIP-associating protein 1-like [Clupea harengus]|uniref:CLIP-associating protein 1-like n=1 Tax=Clupea harengus TaxID=7950 RepID=A0A6P8GDE6_CLUHA|nr:CLIP-associating protein 1-like [Clupea harengus]
MESKMEYILAQVLQKDVGRRLQVGQEIIDYISDHEKSHDLEQDQTNLDKMVDGIATSWVNSSNFKLALLGMDILSALVTRLQDRFRSQIGTVLPSLMDRLGDAKDQVRDQDQTLLIKIMDQAAIPQYVWDRMLGGFKHKNNRTREGVCLCLIATLNAYGAQGLTLSKIVPHICSLLGDPTSQVRDAAMTCLVEIYRHVGERVRTDLSKKGLPQSRLNVIFGRFDEVQRSGNMLSSGSDKNFEDEDSVDGGRSSSSSSSRAPPSGRRGGAVGSMRRPSSASSKAPGKEGASAGALDEDDFMKAFEDVPSVKVHSNRELEDSLGKIREILSDDKHDWEHRVTALKKFRSLLLGGAVEHDAFSQQLRLMEPAFKLSAKDLRSQVVREACITLGHLSFLLGNKFDHTAECIMPILLNLVPNSAKVMATSGVAVIRLILRHTHYPRLIPIITSNCTSKSVAVRRRCYEFLDLMLTDWQSNTLEKHVAVLSETIRKGIHDADSEARSIARKCYWNFHGHYGREAEHLYQALESSYQKALQSHLKGSDSVMSLPQSDRSSSSSQESLNRPFTVKSVIGGSMTRNKLMSSRAPGPARLPPAFPAKSRLSTVPSATPFGSAAALPPGSYASLGRVRTRRQSSGNTVGPSSTVTDSRGRSRAKVVSQSQRKLLGHTYGRIHRTTVPATTPSSEKRTRVPRSQGCSRETSPSRLGLALVPAASPYRTLARTSRIPRPSMSQGCSRDTSRESSRDTSPARGFAPLDRYGLIHQARMSASINAMRVLNTGTEVEAAVADALVPPPPGYSASPPPRIATRT